MGKLLGIAAVVAVLVAAGGTYLYLQKSSPANAANSSGQTSGSGGTKKADSAPEQVVSITPATGTTGVNGASAIQVAFSEPLSASSTMPTVTPAIAGTWKRSGNNAVFVPAFGFKPRTKVTVQVPAGVQSTGGGTLAAPVKSTFRTGRYSNVRMEQLLAQLGYLPLTWAPTTGTAAPLSSSNAQLSAAYSPPAGSYTWQSGYPSELMRLWRPDAPSMVLKGAVMAFESDHGLTLDGVIGPKMWHAMFRALATDATNKHGYTYALASQHVPETLTVWHNGQKIFRNLANTGIPAAPTTIGTAPVYLKYKFQIMKGKNPDGSKYADPVWWVSYFRAGEAVHYFNRYSYGSQQSLGCVELPYAPAKKIWPYLTYGTLVTVTAP
jgi:Bacterial Ig-like domain/L,D-transpeptidase catalytic domain